MGKSRTVLGQALVSCSALISLLVPILSTPFCPNCSWGPGTERLGEKGLFILEMRGLSGGLINAYKYLKGRCKDDKVRLFSVVPSDRTRSTGHKLKHSFCLNIRRHLLTVRVAELWNKLPRETGRFILGDIQNLTGCSPG